MSRVYVDTNILILAFEGGDQRALDIVELLNAFEARPGTLVTSELTLAEIGAQDERSRQLALGLPVLGAFIDFVPVTQSILYETCAYRINLRQEGRQMKLPDAIHCATALRSGCRLLFSGDKRLWLPSQIERIGPDTSGLARLRSFLDA